jgi:EAL domain-containing protein (putative c-di-GMP-specific phosphodiesterase class I)
VVAEGVETAQQEAFLLAHACDALQGYRYHRPMMIASLDRLVTATPTIVPAASGA